MRTLGNGAKPTPRRAPSVSFRLQFPPAPRQRSPRYRLRLNAFATDATRDRVTALRARSLRPPPRSRRTASGDVPGSLLAPRQPSTPRPSDQRNVSWTRVSGAKKSGRIACANPNTCYDYGVTEAESRCGLRPSSRGWPRASSRVLMACRRARANFCPCQQDATPAKPIVLTRMGRGNDAQHRK